MNRAAVLRATIACSLISLFLAGGLVSAAQAACANSPLPTPSDQWKLEIWNNKDLTGAPVEQRYEAPAPGGGGLGFGFIWGNSGTPSSCVGTENYSVRFTRNMFFSKAANYEFTLFVDDGVRFWIDGVNVLDEWRDPQHLDFIRSIPLTEGFHTLQVDYYQALGNSHAFLDWKEVAPTACANSPLPTNDQWKLEIWNNKDLAGAPAEQRYHPGADSFYFQWGDSSKPSSCVGTENYSVRFTRNAYFSKAATYTFTVQVDDGARLWIDGVNLLDEWRDPQVGIFTRSIPLTAGFHTVQVDYYQALGDSHAGLSWTEDTGPPTAPPLQIDILGPAGNSLPDGYSLGLNGDGWPSPNPLSVRVILTCPADQPGGCHGTGFFLTVSSSDERARFYMETNNPGTCTQPVLPRLYSYKLLPWRCSDGLLGIEGINLGPGESRTFNWSMVVQPSEASTLNIAGTWGAASVNASLGIPLAQVHPVILIPGILGTLPPSERIGQIDPILGVYDPLLIQLQKMGYVSASTLQPMPYDWRNANRVSAHHLTEVIDTVLGNVANLPYVNHDGKVDVFGHSMGGLITRAYIQGFAQDDLNPGVAVPYRNDIRKVIFTATPHRGFPETYRTYEGLTWEMYLYGYPVLGVPLLPLAFDSLLWPGYIEKRWRAVHTPGVDYSVSCIRTPDGSYVCDRQSVLYGMSHDAVGGIDSLREMLPTDDSDNYWPYLCETVAGGVCQNPYPFGRQGNPFLNTLNDPASLGLLAGSLGVENIYVIYGRDPGPDNYTDVQYDVGPPPINQYGKVTSYQNGAVEQRLVRPEGDDLIPEYSMNLRLLLPGIPEENVAHGLFGNGARHKEIMYHSQVQNTYVPRYLAGLAPLPFTTPYVGLALHPTTQWWVLAALCPVNLTITDPQDRRIGYNPETGGVFQEIPGAVYAAPGSENQFIILPDPQGGDYRITANAFASGTYSLSLSQLGGAGPLRRWEVGGTVQQGETVNFTAFVDPTLSLEQHPPVAHAGSDQIVLAGPNCQATVPLDGTGSSDPDGEVLRYAWTGPFGAAAGPTPSVMLPIGAHTLTINVTDGQGATAQDTVMVTVVDATPPNIGALRARPNVLRPPNHKMVPVTLEASAADICDTTPRCRIISVTSNEPVTRSENEDKDGDTHAPDWVITGALTVDLRAERGGEEGGRVYTITVRCTDDSGNRSTKTVRVTVPHDD